MSKSKGNVLYADDLVDFFGVDAVRYFVLHEMPFENDGVISWELMVERLNSDLANTLGNLVNRTISMSNKYFGGVVADRGAAEAVDEDLKAVVTQPTIRLRQRWKAGESQTRSPIFYAVQALQQIYRRDRAVGAGKRPCKSRPSCYRIV